MKNVYLLFTALLFLSTVFISCTSEDDKEISGTIVFNEIGTHSFNINAERIDATITISGPNQGELIVFEHVELSNTVAYTANIGVKTSDVQKNELLNNLVVMYEAKEGQPVQNNSQDIADSGYVKIDWRGVY